MSVRASRLATDLGDRIAEKASIVKVLKRFVDLPPAQVRAQVLIAESCERQHIDVDQRIIHAGRGLSMISQPVALLLATLGVVPSHS